MSETVFDRVARLRIVPVIALDTPEAALPLADTLTQGGLPIAEITFRTAAAAEAIRRLRGERPDMLVGAGTLLTPAQVRQAADAGAAFGVAPGLNPAVVSAARDAGLPFAPGVMTPSDIEGALSFGLRVLKFFPAVAAGGLPMLASIVAPFSHLGLGFIPLGGVSPQNMADWLKERCVVAVGGTWIAKKESIMAGDWETIRGNCRRAVETARAVAGGKPAA